MPNGERNEKKKITIIIVEKKCLKLKRRRAISNEIFNIQTGRSFVLLVPAFVLRPFPRHLGSLRAREVPVTSGSVKLFMAGNNVRSIDVWKGTDRAFLSETSRKKNTRKSHRKRRKSYFIRIIFVHRLFRNYIYKYQISDSQRCQSGGLTTVCVIFFFFWSVCERFFY